MDAAAGNSKRLGQAGLMLLLLGALSLALVYVRADVSAETVRLAAGTGVLFALGCSTLAAAGVRRLEARVTELEKQLAARE